MPGSTVPPSQNSTTVPRDHIVLIVTPSSKTLAPGETQQLTVSGTTGAPKWSSTRPSVATVSKLGLVTAVAAGVAVITVRSGNQSASSTITVSGAPVPDPVIPPTAKLAVITLSGNTTADPFTFVLTGTQANGGATLVSGSLNYGDGSTPLALPPFVQQVDHFYATDDTYTATLSVTDSNGKTSTATVQVVVNPVPDPPPPPINQSPIAVLDHQSGQFINQPYVFTTTGTRDPDGTIASWLFTPGDGGATQGGSGSPPSTITHTYTVAGDWTASLAVTDDGGLVGTATRTASVTSQPPPPNQPPQVTIGFVSGGTAGSPYVVSVTAVDPDGSVAVGSGTVQWGDGSSEPYTGNGNYSHVYASAGTYTIRATVVDNLGLSGTATRSATITAVPPPNQPPVAHIAQVGSATVGSPATFSTSGTADPDGTIASGLVTWGDGTTTPIGGAPNPTYQHTYATAGTKTVTFQVTDNSGATSSVSISVSVSAVNQPPTAQWVVTAGSFAGDLYQFSTAGTTDPEGPIASYAIDYGDGSGENAPTPPPSAPSHVYVTAGTYTATLIVTDSGGLMATKPITVTVLPVTPPPPGGTPLSRNEHPRLCLTLADLPGIGVTCSSGGGWASSFQSAVTDIETNYWSSISTTDANSLVYAISMAGLVYNLRKAGVLTGVTFTKTNAEWLAKGVAYLLQLSTNILTMQPARQCAHVAWYLWLGYDWLHDGLNGTQRQQLYSDHCIVGIGSDSPFNTYDAIVAFKAAAPGTAAGNNPRVWSAETTTRGFSRMITAALAIQGDNLSAGGVNSNTWATEQISWYDPAFDNIYDGQLNRESQRGGTDGSAIQGFGTYGESYDHNWLVTMAWAWRTANGLTKTAYYGASGRSYFRGMARYMFYMLRQFPHGSQKLFVKDLYSNADTHAGEFELQMQMGHARAELQGVDNDAAALAAYFIANKGIDSEKRWVFSRFLAPPVTAQSPAAVALPLSKAFLPGQWQFRSGWLSNNDTIVNIWGYEFSGFNSAVGNFSIDYMGPAIITPGYGGHDLDASWHAGGENTLGCPELNRTTLQTGDDHNDDYGFQRAANPRVPDFIPNTSVDWADRTEIFHAIDATDNYGYLWLDRTRSFNGNLISDGLANSLKVPVDSVYRQFVVFQPTSVGTTNLVVFVFDQMTVLSHSPIFQKRVHTYYSGIPTVTGASSSSAGPSRNGSTTGKTTYSGGSPLITNAMTQDSTTVKVWHTPFCQTAAIDVVLVEMRRYDGAIGWMFEDPYGRLTAGSTFSSSPTGTFTGADLQKYIGAYRTEIIPTTGNLTDRFVQVYEVGPSSGSPSTTEDWSGTNFQAARCGTLAAAMGATQKATTSGTIICKTAGTYSLAIGNLTASSTRTLAKGANITSITKVNGGGTGPTYTVGADGVLYVTVVVASSGTGAANTITVS